MTAPDFSRHGRTALVTGTRRGIGRAGALTLAAAAVVFLASPAARYANGHVLVVDGGWLAR